MLSRLPRTAWLEIDLDALVSNMRLIADALPTGTRLDPVVKGDAYGHGAVPVALALQDAGAGELCVATYDEALELRQGGVRLPILILYPVPTPLLADAIGHGFAVTAGDPTLLARTLDAVAGIPSAAGVLDLHLEVETGLGRGGLHPEEVADAVRAIEATPRVRLAALWSHLQAADDARRTSGQTDQFERARALLDDVSIPVPMRHMSASGGVLASTGREYDAVRVGLSLYGIVPDGLLASPERAEVARQLRPVMALRARPVRVTTLQAGTGVSYGPSFVTSRDSRIATLPVGYADGYPRSLSNRAEALVRGRRVRTVGTVAMDAVMVDVTDVPGEPVTVDDDFTLLGTQGEERIEATEMARWGNTISYEVVTAMSRRLPRVYYAAARPVARRTLAEERGDRAPSGGPGSSPAPAVIESMRGPLA